MFIRVEEFAGFWVEKKQEVTAGGYIRLLQHNTGVNSEQLSVAVNFRAFVREKSGSKLSFILFSIFFPLLSSIIIIIIIIIICGPE
jgi:hypothetical protein